MKSFRSFLVAIVLLVPLCASRAQADSSLAHPIDSSTHFPVWIDLSGPWKINFQDRPDFAQPDFDDHAWQSTDLPGELPDIRSGVRVRGWLRRRIDFPSNTDCTHLALTLGVITQSRYEIFLNGQRLPSSETLSPFDVRISRPITHAIPPCRMPYPKELVIAIHFASFDMHPDWRVPDRGPYLLTDQANAPARVGDYALAEQRNRVAPPLIFAIAVFLMLAILCLVTWSADRPRTELLWFALVAAERIGYSISAVAGLYPSASSLPARLNFVGEFISLPLLGEVAFSALSVRHRNWYRAVNWLIVLPMLSFTLGRTSFMSAVLSCIASGLFLAGIIVSNWWQQRHSGLSIEDHLLRVVLLVPGVQIAVYWAAYLKGVVLYAFGDMGWVNLPIFRFESSWFVMALAIFAILMRRALADRRTQQRLVQELEAARQVQNLLVSGGCAVADDLVIDTAYLPAQEVGGDFYYVLDGRVVVLGDVSGKGLKAAMLVSLLIGVLRDTRERRPAAVLAALNHAVSGQTDGGFVTCLCVCFEENGTARFANAGHLPPYKDGVEIDLPASVPLGILRDVTYTEAGVSMTANSVITLISDGVVEATNPRRELFGFDRTRSISNTQAAKIVEAARDWGQSDDITVVTIRRKP
jgi:hypothetical protein